MWCIGISVQSVQTLCLVSYPMLTPFQSLPISWIIQILEHSLILNFFNLVELVELSIDYILFNMELAKFVLIKSFLVLKPWH